ncbi:MAG: carboxypeptidase-like regulatory domain-containing protein, partial [Alistipes sp.]|nr:carboxypeptidase-like regulatory domain-containing protein [Alistipes sp.]
MKKLLSLLSIIAAFTLSANAANTIDDRRETNIQGHVINSTTGEHIPYINVTIEGTTIGTTTDAEGHYMILDVPAGKYVIVASAIGYDTVQKEIVVVRGEHMHVNFETRESQVSLDAVVVSSNRNESTRREAPSLVSVIDTRLFETASAPTLADGLSFQSGLRVE